MKRLLVLLTAITLALSFTACKTQKTDVNAENETVVREEGIIYSFHTLENAEDAKNDGFFAVSFDPDKDILKDENGYNITVNLYDYDMYNYDDIATLEVGSKITMCQEIHTVETLETEEETGIITINGGRENGGFILLPQALDYRTDNEENGCPYLYEVGKITLPLADDFKYTDNTNPGADGKGTQTGLDKFPASLEKGEFGFIPENTSIEVREGKITHLIKYVIE